MFRTLKGRVALAAACLIAIGIALATSLQSHFSERNVLSSIMAQHEALTQHAALEIDEKLRFARGTLAHLSRSIPEQALSDPAALGGYLRALAALRSLFHSIVVFDLDGRVVAATPAMDAQQRSASVADRDWFKASLAHGGVPVISAPLVSRLSGYPLVVTTFPVFDDVGILRAVIVGSLRLDQDHLLRSVARVAIGQSGYFILLSGDGGIVVHPDSRFVARHVDALGALAEPIMRAIAQRRGALAAVDPAGGRSLLAFHPVGIADWVLVGIQPDHEALASLDRLSRTMILTGGLLAILLIPVMWWVVSRMLRPLDEMRVQIRNVAAGREPDGGPEVGGWAAELRQVAREFADMMKARRAAEAALLEEKERAEVTLQSIGDGVITTDREGRIRSMNPVAELLTAWRLDAARGRPFAEVFTAQNEETNQPIPDMAMRAMRDDTIIDQPHSIVLHAKDGRLIPVDHSAAPIHDADGAVDGAVVVFRDVARERATVQELNWRASHDTMTGLANRAAYESALERLFATHQDGEQHAVLMIDVDQFKIVNDTSGHAAGDELLRRLARLCSERARKSDVVARLGGDEFAVIMYHCPGEKALRLAEELRRDVAAFRFVWDAHTYRVGVSIGLVAVDRSYESANEVQKAADMACYMAKRGGRNRICVHSRDNRQLEVMRSEMHAVSRIHSAIEEDRLRLYAQSIVPIGGRAEEGMHFEVLLRMVDESGLLIPPGAFLPAAERYGLMDELDRWVISHAAAACARRFGPDQWHLLQTVAINLSPTTLREESIGPYIIEQLQHHGVPLRCVCFEVTESAAVENLDTVCTLMNDLRAKGVRFALDDFGVGMTSLAQLRDLPVDVLKIDGSFIGNIGKDRVNGSMVYAIQNIARLLSMKTIAERVESEEELAHLEALGVNYAQGYLLARPQPIEDMLRVPSAP